jgi:hypothetical protein
MRYDAKDVEPHDRTHRSKLDVDRGDSRYFH